MEAKEKTQSTVVPMENTAAKIKVKVAELNALLVEAKKDLTVRISISVKGVSIKEVGIVNQLAISITRTTEL